MNQETLWLEFSTLPPSAQKLVVEFMDFVQKCYNQIQFSTPINTPQTELVDEEFVGMWRDRDDLKDSSDWVRQVRRNEWRVKA